MRHCSERVSPQLPALRIKQILVLQVIAALRASTAQDNMTNIDTECGVQGTVELRLELHGMCFIPAELGGTLCEDHKWQSACL